jgi:hypothetical protein
MLTGDHHHVKYRASNRALGGPRCANARKVELLVDHSLLPTAGQIPRPIPRLSTRQAAEYTGVAESTLRYYRHAGIGPASYTITSKVFYDVADLDDWISAQKAASLRGGV